MEVFFLFLVALLAELTAILLRTPTSRSTFADLGLHKADPGDSWLLY
jgi:hypothetical protein